MLISNCNSSIVLHFIPCLHSVSSMEESMIPLVLLLVSVMVNERATCVVMIIVMVRVCIEKFLVNEGHYQVPHNCTYVTSDARYQNSSLTYFLFLTNGAICYIDCYVNSVVYSPGASYQKLFFSFIVFLTYGTICYVE